MALLVPLTFATLARGSWVRSWAWGMAVLHAMFAIKVLWTYAIFNQGAARAHFVAAATGFAASGRDDGGLLVVGVVMGQDWAGPAAGAMRDAEEEGVMYDGEGRHIYLAYGRGGK